MDLQTIELVVNELKDIPQDKASSIIDYLHFLKYEDIIKENIKIPNQETLDVFKDTDEGKNLNVCKDINDLFKRLKI